MNKQQVIISLRKSICKVEGLDDAQVDEFVFHMTDWLDDLVAYQAFLDNPDHISPDEVKKVLMKFLVHVPYHLNLASKILLKENDD